MVSLLIADSVTKLDAEARGAVLVAASHGGVYAAFLAAKAGLRAVILNDAGIGREDAGVAGLDFLDRLGIPAAAVGHLTARIGDGADMMARGRLTRVNEAARHFRCTPDMSCAEAAERLKAAPHRTVVPPPYAETRTLLCHEPGEAPIWGLDSNSLVRPEDAGTVVVTGSHGGLLGGRPETAIRVDALAAVFNDAGIGIDNAGISRLPALEARGIAAVTVAAASARIGEARSTWETGRISAVNETARRWGAAIGASARDFARLACRRAR
ncbi:MAG: hypothetical protein JO010_01810 [Alphaproteobacteria bacterium]|nr:hypothetical protein [Alphaproteobacteria bacterium]